MAEWCGLRRYEDYGGAEEPCIDCVQSFEEMPTEFSPKRPHKPKATRADRFRASTDEELAEFLEKVGGCGPSFDKKYCNNVNGCPEGSNCWLYWLRQEAHDDH